MQSRLKDCGEQAGGGGCWAFYPSSLRFSAARASLQSGKLMLGTGTVLHLHTHAHAPFFLPAHPHSEVRCCSADPEHPKFPVFILGFSGDPEGGINVAAGESTSSASLRRQRWRRPLFVSSRTGLDASFFDVHALIFVFVRHQRLGWPVSLMRGPPENQPGQLRTS